MTCRYCHLVKHVSVFPYHCSCGKVHQGASIPRLPRRSCRINRLGCIHRGDKIGIAECGCDGDIDVFACRVHGQCMRRQIKRGPVRVTLGDSEPTSVAMQYCNECERRQSWSAGAVAIITTHWNVHGYSRLRETYEEWLPTIDHPVQCFELVMGTSPEIDGSCAIRGSARNLMWQKERLINLAVSRLSPEVQYVAWIDHDMVFENPRWLTQSIDLLAGGVDAVQPFDSIRFLDRDGRAGQSSPGGVATVLAGKPPKTCPGAAWIARRDFLDRIGGLYENNIVGGGDAVWFYGVTNCQTKFLDRQSGALAEDARRWVANVKGATFDFLPGSLTHLWHGERANRQYVSRDAILRDYDFDPRRHIEIDDAGLLAWTNAAPAELRAAVKNYFAARRDDG